MLTAFREFRESAVCCVLFVLWHAGFDGFAECLNSQEVVFFSLRGKCSGVRWVSIVLTRHIFSKC